MYVVQNVPKTVSLLLKMDEISQNLTILNNRRHECADKPETNQNSLFSDDAVWTVYVCYGKLYAL